MSEDSILASIFRVGDQVKRNLRDAYSDPLGYLEGAVIENHKNWKKKPDEMSMGFFNPVPLGTMGNFVLRKEIEDAVTNLSRRDFLKKSAGIAGGSAAASIPGAKLLQKFAPEERAIAKEVAVEAAPKYKYNSLKEYLDDVARKSFEEADTMMYNAMPGTTVEGVTKYRMRDRLLDDEAMYREARDLGGKEYQSIIDSFSPKAKKEMKAWKEAIRNNEASARVDATPEGKAFWESIGDDPGFGTPFPKGYEEYQRLNDLTNEMLYKARKEVNWADHIMDYFPR